MASNPRTAATQVINRITPDTAPCSARGTRYYRHPRNYPGYSTQATGVAPGVSGPTDVGLAGLICGVSGHFASCSEWADQTSRSRALDSTEISARADASMRSSAHCMTAWSTTSFRQQRPRHSLTNRVAQMRLSWYRGRLRRLAVPQNIRLPRSSR